MQVPLTPLRFLDRSAKYYADKTALICGDHNVSYKEFHEHVDQAANLFSGLRSDDNDPPRIVFITWNCHRVIEACFAAMRAGVIRVPLNVRLTAKDWSYLINDVSAKAVVIDMKFLDRFMPIISELPSVERFYVLTQNSGDKVPEGFLDYNAEVSKQSTAWTSSTGYIPESATVEIFYTSGTTGKPKGVLMNTRNLYTNAVNSFLPLELRSTDIYLHSLGLFHINGWGALHYMTACGGTQIIMRKFSPEDFCKLVEKHRVTLTGMVPTMLNMLTDLQEIGEFDLSSLRLVQSGGALLPNALGIEAEEKLGCPIIGSYGLTETAPVVSLVNDIHGKEERGKKGDGSYYKQRFCAGIETLDCEIKVIGDEGKEVAWDSKQVGEVMVRGNIVTEGYWHDEGGTDKAFTGGGEQWLRTGDLAVIDHDGFTHIADRKKDLIIRGGENISSLEIEDVLRKHPSVLEAAVIPVLSDQWGEEPLAIVVTRENKKVEESVLLEHCGQHLARFKIPSEVRFVFDLPKSGTGKILKRELRKLYK